MAKCLVSFVIAGFGNTNAMLTKVLDIDFEDLQDKYFEVDQKEFADYTSDFILKSKLDPQKTMVKDIVIIG